MKALILSGGTGTRLRPVTFTNAKQLIPVANKPILYYLIEKVANAGIVDIGIIIGNTGKDIITKVGNGRKWNVNITYIHQPYPLGLAHAVKIAQNFIGDSKFIMLLGDNLFSMELDSMIKEFDKGGYNASLLLHEIEDPSGYGVAQVKDNKIVRLFEKPETFISNLIITGVYLFDENIFPAIDNITPSTRGELEITDAIQKMLDMGQNISFKKNKGWWKDTGNLDDLLDANRLVLEGIPPSNIDTTAVISGSRIHKYAAVGANCELLNCYIGPYTSIGDNTVIKNCRIENSIILDNCNLSDIEDKITNSLIGRNSKFMAKKKDLQDISFFVGDNSEIYL